MGKARPNRELSAIERGIERSVRSLRRAVRAFRKADSRYARMTPDYMRVEHQRKEAMDEVRHCKETIRELVARGKSMGFELEAPEFLRELEQRDLWGVEL